MAKNVQVPSTVVREYLNAAGITEGHGSRGRISLTNRVAFVAANPKVARQAAAAAGLALSSKKGRLSKSDAEAVALTLIGG
jgi:TPP-dependent pyruvate/acetoin dehydrogenase alpha subunit